MILGNSQIIAPATLSIRADWTFVYVHCALKTYQSYFTSFYSSSGGVFRSAAFSANPIPTPFSFSSSDVARLGGPSSFLGRIAHFKILSPGSFAFKPGTDYYGASSRKPNFLSLAY